MQPCKVKGLGSAVGVQDSTFKDVPKDFFSNVFLETCSALTAEVPQIMPLAYEAS